MNTPLLIYLIAADVLALLLMLSDKQRANRRERRIPEASLFLAALLGGGKVSSNPLSLFGSLMNGGQSRKDAKNNSLNGNALMSALLSAMK